MTSELEAAKARVMADLERSASFAREVGGKPRRTMINDADLLTILAAPTVTDEAVEAGARALWRHYYEHENTGWDQEQRDAHWNEKGAADLFRSEARAALTAAAPLMGGGNSSSRGSGQRGCGSRDEASVGATAALAPWVPWFSGKFPGHPDDRVDIRLSASEYDGTEERELFNVRADDWGWDWADTDPRIIAWRFNASTPLDGGEAVHGQVVQQPRDELPLQEGATHAE